MQAQGGSTLDQFPPGVTACPDSTTKTYLPDLSSPVLTPHRDHKEPWAGGDTGPAPATSPLSLAPPSMPHQHHTGPPGSVMEQTQVFSSLGLLGNHSPSCSGPFQKAMAQLSWNIHGAQMKLDSKGGGLLGSCSHLVCTFFASVEGNKRPVKGTERSDSLPPMCDDGLIIFLTGERRFLTAGAN